MIIAATLLFYGSQAYISKKRVDNPAFFEKMSRIQKYLEMSHGGFIALTGIEICRQVLPLNLTGLLVGGALFTGIALFAVYSAKMLIRQKKFEVEFQERPDIQVKWALSKEQKRLQTLQLAAFGMNLALTFHNPLYVINVACIAYSIFKTCHWHKWVKFKRVYDLEPWLGKDDGFREGPLKVHISYRLCAIPNVKNEDCLICNRVIPLYHFCKNHHCCAACLAGTIFSKNDYFIKDCFSHRDILEAKNLVGKTYRYPNYWVHLESKNLPCCPFDREPPLKAEIGIKILDRYKEKLTLRKPSFISL